MKAIIFILLLSMFNVYGRYRPRYRSKIRCDNVYTTNITTNNCNNCKYVFYNNKINLLDYYYINNNINIVYLRFIPNSIYINNFPIEIYYQTNNYITFYYKDLYIKFDRHDSFVNVQRFEFLWWNPYRESNYCITYKKSMNRIKNNSTSPVWFDYYDSYSVNIYEHEAYYTCYIVYPYIFNEINYIDLKYNNLTYIIKIDINELLEKINTNKKNNIYIRNIPFFEMFYHILCDKYKLKNCAFVKYEKPVLYFTYETIDEIIYNSNDFFKIEDFKFEVISLIKRYLRYYNVYFT